MRLAMTAAALCLLSTNVYAGWSCSQCTEIEPMRYLYSYYFDGQYAGPPTNYAYSTPGQCSAVRAQDPKCQALPPPPPPPPPPPAGNVASKSFRCEPVDSSYPSLDQSVHMTVHYTDGREVTSSLLQVPNINFCSGGGSILAVLGGSCSYGGACTVHSCVPTDPEYLSLDTNKVEISIDAYGRAAVRTTDHFSTYSSCQSSL